MFLRSRLRLHELDPTHFDTICRGETENELYSDDPCSPHTRPLVRAETVFGADNAGSRIRRREFHLLDCYPAEYR